MFFQHLWQATATPIYMKKNYSIGAKQGQVIYIYTYFLRKDLWAKGGGIMLKHDATRVQQSAKKGLTVSILGLGCFVR